MAMTAPWGNSTRSAHPARSHVCLPASVDPVNDSPDRIQQALWNIDGHEVTVPAGGHRLRSTRRRWSRSIVWPAGFVHINERRHSARRTDGGHHPDCMGTGVARQLRSELLHLVPMKIANQSSNGPPERLADVVEVAVGDRSIRLLEISSRASGLVGRRCDPH